jgi:hypothetical protein
MGSGGTRALWPANPKVHVNSSFINLSLQVDASSLTLLLYVGFACEGIMHIFKIWQFIHLVARGCSLGRYDDGLQKQSRHLQGSLGTYNINPTHKGNEESLEMSYQTGETRRSSVQIRPAPPRPSFAQIGKFWSLFQNYDAILGLLQSAT